MVWNSKNYDSNRSPARGGEDDLTYSCGSVPPKKLQIKSKNRTGLFGFGLVD